MRVLPLLLFLGLSVLQVAYTLSIPTLVKDSRSLSQCQAYACVAGKTYTFEEVQNVRKQIGWKSTSPKIATVHPLAIEYKDTFSDPRPDGETDDLEDTIPPNEQAFDTAFEDAAMLAYMQPGYMATVNVNNTGYMVTANYSHTDPSIIVEEAENAGTIAYGNLVGSDVNMRQDQVDLVSNGIVIGSFIFALIAVFTS
ncbi:hypothetical protein OC845_006846 [Tilletia horrida]|nr:hypothetical protein OC845_006846 [Tilletia horrida]